MQATPSWDVPLRAAAACRDEDMCLLYSGREGIATGGTSFLALNPIEVIEAETLDALDSLSGDGYWFGYLSYELRHSTETLDATATGRMLLPRLRLVRYENLYRFDHNDQSIEQIAGARPLPDTDYQAPTAPKTAALRSPMSKDAYLESVKATISAIEAGDFYQANITRKFQGDWQEAPNYFGLFLRLHEASPAPYSAYIRHGEQAILSSSPELFLTCTADGKITSRPIKGTLPRDQDAAELASSSKDKAENLMIVDLMRNDLSRICTAGSVSVDNLFAVQSFATLHHMVSSIEGTLSNNLSNSARIGACFPPGSMTGAPKIAAINWCARQEKLDRGVYSGAIGWIRANGEMDLSVVIRTLICDAQGFEFQVGGGIVADSIPEQEWQETLTKARGICAALGISTEDLAKL